MIEHSWNNCWNRTNFSKVTERIEQVIVRIWYMMQKRWTVLPGWWQFEQLLGQACRSGHAAYLTDIFLMCFWSTVIMVWIMTLCISFISYEHVAFWALQSFSKVTLFSLPEVFCGPQNQICQKCVGGRRSAPDPAGGAYSAPHTPSRLGRGIPPPHSPLHSAPSAPRFVAPNVKSSLRACCSVGFMDMADWMCNHHLCHVTGSDHA